jgi:hypothetical protein
MKKELVIAWIEALRSGNYQQHAMGLWNRDKTSFCCLGVAALIHPHSDALIDEFGRQFLPPSMACDFGINGSTKVDYENFDSIQYYLAHMNDNGATFEQIADWLEKNVLAIAGKE